jgi:hypothetical protein
MNDIELDKNGAGFEDGEGWKSIGYFNDDEDDEWKYSFTGIFNGNNHKITNIWINRPDTKNVGLFGFAHNARIKNLSVEIAKGKEVRGKNYVGGIVGSIDKSDITNSYVTGNISSNNNCVGGIAGNISGGSTVTDSYSTGNINGNDGVGGIAGYVERSNITNSYSTGNVSGNGHIGGITGSVCESFVTSSYFVGSTSGNNNVGGIAGYIENSSITNNAAINSSVKGFESTNRAIGQIYSQEIPNNFARKALTSGFTKLTEGNKYSGIGKDDSEFVSKETYKTGLKWKFGNDKDNPWKIDEDKNYGLPYLYWQNVPTTKRKIFDKANISIPSGNELTHTISFMDGSLNVINSITISEGIVNIVDIACEFGIVYHLYTLNSSDSVLSNPAYESYNLTEDISFYTFPNVKGIITQKDLDDIRNDLNGRYILMNDIELDENGAGFDADGWLPIGDKKNEFKCIFDGNNHKITGLWINRPRTDYVGLFGFARNARIKNLSVEIAEGKEVKGKDYVGGIFGKLEHSSIVNSCSLGNISGKDYVGGIAGEVGSIGSREEAISSITNSYSIGNISGKGSVGGIAGYVDENSSITNSYSIGNISGNKNVGGIAGYVDGGYGNSTPIIINSYSIGNISSNNSVGGIVGLISKGYITNNAAINSSIKSFKSANRIIGETIDYRKEISNNFTRKALTSGFTDFRDSNECSGIDKDDSEFVSKETYEVGLGWKFGNDNANPWKIDTTKNYGLPYLYWQDVPTTKKKIFDKVNISIPNGNILTHTVSFLDTILTSIGVKNSIPTHTISFIDGNLNIINSITVPEGIVNIVDIACELGIVYHLYMPNSSDNVLSNPAYESYNLTKDIKLYAFPNVKEIRTQEELNNIRDDLNSRYILMNDIELDENGAGFDADGWIPIGCFNDEDDEDDEWKYSFTGIFNGNNYKITNIWINRPDTKNVGLFGYIYNAHIKNLGVEIASKGIVGNENVGGIAGSVDDGSSITNSYSTGNINGNGNVGGIAGIVNRYSDITNSYSTGDISGNKNVGGIAGYVNGGYNNSTSIIINSYSIGNINGNDNVGGIAGNVCESNITNSYSIGNINGNDNVGGISGSIDNESNITNSYSTGDIKGDKSVGGIVGSVNDGHNKHWSNSYITDSYSTGNISGNENIGGIAGLVEHSNITDSYSTGDISGKEKIGGIAGYVYKGDIIYNAAINSSVKGLESANRVVGCATSCFNYSSIYNFTRKALTSGFTDFEDDNDCSGKGKDDSEFLSKKTYKVGLEWKFGDDKDNPWKIDSSKNNGYPYLYWQDL